jgi:hypothetical protein
MAQFFDAAALARVPTLELRIAKPSSEELIEAVRDATAIIHFQTRLNEPTLAACPHLRIVVTIAALAFAVDSDLVIVAERADAGLWPGVAAAGPFAGAVQKGGDRPVWHQP